MKITVQYIDTSNPDYRPWQLDNDQPMLICIGCHRLVQRRHPLSNRCRYCWKHKKTPNAAEYRHRRRTKRKHSEGVGWRCVRKQWLKGHPSCVMCGATEYLTVDHIVPLSHGGHSEPGNLQTLCEACHAMKTLAESITYDKRCQRNIAGCK